MLFYNETAKLIEFRNIRVVGVYAAPVASLLL